MTLAAWQERWAIAQLWVAGVSIVAAFVVRRLLARVPIALLSGIAGAALVAVAAVLGAQEESELWQLDRGVLTAPAPLPARELGPLRRRPPRSSSWRGIRAHQTHVGCLP